MNDHRHYHTESERRQLDGAVTDSDKNGWNISKLNRMKPVQTIYLMNH